ncbi:MAG: Na+/H+ antiporter [Eggerthellaceae bacterium]
MEVFELVLILLACVIASSVLDQMVGRVSLPLIQIAVGFVVALLIPATADVHVESELFLVLFIAPLLFNEARESSRHDLWVNKGAILSLAIGLVLLTVLIVGFALHAIVPSIPLAAAFACAAALGPTDAAAVGALGSTVALTNRQKTLLSGESLINDASGVVSFQFAIAAAVTGTFSAVDAGTTFAVLFFGGIAAGVVFGWLARSSMGILRRSGFENTTVHVLYEVFTPFAVFLAAEALGVSGILAVVAAGLVMAERTTPLSSTEDIRRHTVSNGFWEIIVFLINGVIFVLLGMQLPQAISPTLSASYSLPFLLGVVVALTAMVMGCRLVWTFAMELLHKDKGASRRGATQPGKAFKRALITTIAGPKGAVTLSIILTIPLVLDDGSAFPERNLIIFLTAGVILLTLLLADSLLPLLAPKEASESNEAETQEAMIKVLVATIDELSRRVTDGANKEYEPAIRLTIGQYRARLLRERLEVTSCGGAMTELMNEVLVEQQKYAAQVAEGCNGVSEAATMMPYNALLSSVRVGRDGGVRIPPRAMLKWRFRKLKKRLKPSSGNGENMARTYYDSCLISMKLEKVALAYLEEVMKTEDRDTPRYQAAEALRTEHQSAYDGIRSRLSAIHTDDDNLIYKFDNMPAEVRDSFVQQFKNAKRYSDEVYQGALQIELDEIRHLQERGEIDRRAAQQLREDVYLMQVSLDA